MAELTTPSSSTTAPKRDHGTPMKHPPRRPKKRISLREKEQSLERERSSRRLPLFPQTSAATWSVDKLKALVEFVLFHTDLDKWRGAASFVQT